METDQKNTTMLVQMCDGRVETKDYGDGVTTYIQAMKDYTFNIRRATLNQTALGGVSPHILIVTLVDYTSGERQERCKIFDCPCSNQVSA